MMEPLEVSNCEAEDFLGPSSLQGPALQILLLQHHETARNRQQISVLCLNLCIWIGKAPGRTDA